MQDSGYRAVTQRGAVIQQETGAQKAAGRSRGPLRSRGPRRREEILAAAAALFAQRGFHGVTIDDIGSAVGMSGPGIYRHFPGKEAVLAQMLVNISQRLLDEGGRRATSAPDAQSALDALLRWHVGFALSQPDLITVQSRELANVPEPARRQIRRLQRLYVEEWVTVLSELSPHAPQAGLRTAVHAMFGLLNSTPHSVSDLPPEAAAELLRTMARAALMAASADRAGEKEDRVARRLGGERGIGTGRSHVEVRADNEPELA